MEDAVRVATVEDRDAVVATVVVAFEHDPALRYFFPNDDRYAVQATAFFGALFDRRVGHGTVWVHGPADAVAMWSPPSQPTPSATGHAAWPDVIGPAELARIDAYQSVVDELLPDVAEHWYLGVLATLPEQRGRGLGQVLMRAGLAGVGTGAAHLETTNPGNVGYYESAGWEVVASNDGGAPLPIWVLRHHGR